MRIVETDNFGSDYPDERFVNIPRLNEEACQEIANIINRHTGLDYPRYWKVVNDEYQLQPGFEP